MRCPACIQHIHETAPECPHCGGTLESVSENYAGCLTTVNGGLDAAGVLNIKEREQVRKWAVQAAKRLPEVTVGVSYVAIEDGQSIQSYGFWLLNQGEFQHQGDKPDDGRVLLVFDVKKKQACLFFGFRMDKFVKEDETFQVLACGHPYLLELNYPRATQLILESLTHYLRKISGRARRYARRQERRAR